MSSNDFTFHISPDIQTIPTSTADMISRSIICDIQSIGFLFKISWQIALSLCITAHLKNTRRQKEKVLHSMNWGTPIEGVFMNYNNCCCGENSTQGINRYVFITGPQGPAGEDGTATLGASTNRNDTTQTVATNAVVSITGTNVLTNDEDMLFVNNTVRINNTGLYLITATVEATGDAGAYTFAITVNDTDYTFVINITGDATTGTTSHTIYLNISTSPTVVSIYNRGQSTVTINKAELNVVRLA